MTSAVPWMNNLSFQPIPGLGNLNSGVYWDLKKGSLTPERGPTFTWTRATASYRRQNGVLVPIISGAPRWIDTNLSTGGGAPFGAATNIVLHNNDQTNAVWVKSDMTAAMDQAGPDGVAASASSLTATAGNATSLQTIVSASALRSQETWIRRITGSGTIQMTTDNGTTWGTVTVTGTWAKVRIPTQTLANPVVGFRIVTSGDAIAVGKVQNTGVVDAPESDTTTTAFVCNADVVTATYAGGTEGTLYVKALGPVDIAGFRGLLHIDDGSTANRIRLACNGNAADVLISSGGSGVAAYNVPTWGAGNSKKLAARYRLNDFNAAFNGTAQTADTGGAVPVGMTAISLGGFSASLEPNTVIQETALSSVGATDANLATATTP